MLKIAEYNKKTGKKIELKELEEYGFEMNNSFYYKKEFTTDFNDSGNKHEILIYTTDRSIALDIMNNDYTYHSFNTELGNIEDTLYDLINDGYIEKVEE